MVRSTALPDYSIIKLIYYLYNIKRTVLAVYIDIL